jgi:uncharacterized RDD family membrane protein YckC
MDGGHQLIGARYVGFWLRVLAAVVDSVWVTLVLVPVLLALYGRDYFEPFSGAGGGALDTLINLALPALAVLAFWIYRLATPGKMLISARIVDARTGERPSNVQLIGRYLGYYVSIIPFCLGLIWVAFDPRKQGWHDKLAGTVVVRVDTERKA